MGDWRERKQLSNNCGMDKCANENMQICEDPEIVYLLVCKIFKFHLNSQTILHSTYFNGVRIESCSKIRHCVKKLKSKLVVENPLVQENRQKK